MLFCGTLLFFALISYTPRDVPSWVWFSQYSPANHPAQNFIGPVGAIVAGVCYWFIGAAAYLLAAILLGFGVAKLFYPGLQVTRRLAWIVLFIVSGACLLHVQPYHLRGWHAAFNIQGPGGCRARGVADIVAGRLCYNLDPGHGCAPDPPCSRSRRSHAARRGQTFRMAIAPQAAQIRSERETGNQRKTTRQAAAPAGKTAEEERAVPN